MNEETLRKLVDNIDNEGTLYMIFSKEKTDSPLAYFDNREEVTKAIEHLKSKDKKEYFCKMVVLYKNAKTYIKALNIIKDSKK